MKEDEVSERFRSIAAKAKSLGITFHQLSSLSAVKALKNKRKSCIRRYIYPVLIASFIGISVLTGAFMLGWPVSRSGLLRVWMSWYHMDIEEEPCLVEISDMIRDISRPPVDCAICRDVTEVVKVSKLTPEDFESLYAYSGRPVVITDGSDGWSAMDTFSFSFFKNIYGDDSPVLYNVEQHCQFFPYKTDFRSLGEVFNMSEERATMRDGSKPWYIGWSNCDSSATNVLREHYRRPYFLPALAESSRTDWIFMGSPGYGAHMHIDDVGQPSWQAQITGEKLWTLEPPPECYSECVAQLQVTVRPGEIIVLDTNQWFHSTLITSSTMSITIGSEYT